MYKAICCIIEHRLQGFLCNRKYWDNRIIQKGYMSVFASKTVSKRLCYQIAKENDKIVSLILIDTY